MPTVKIELLGNVNLYFGLGLEIVTAIILGGLIGQDREKKLKSAGIKTNILICLGATLYTAISMINYTSGIATPSFDPNRTASQIVSGIGFLGAGAIIQSRGAIVGLTTAATIWVVAAVGVTIGMGFPLVATIFTVTIWVVLRFINPLYRLFNVTTLYHLEVESNTSLKKFLLDQLIILDVNYSNLTEQIIDEKSKYSVLNIDLRTKQKSLKKLLERVGAEDSVVKFTYHVPINGKR